MDFGSGERVRVHQRLAANVIDYGSSRVNSRNATKNKIPQ